MVRSTQQGRQYSVCQCQAFGIPESYNVEVTQHTPPWFTPAQGSRIMPLSLDRSRPSMPWLLTIRAFVIKITACFEKDPGFTIVQVGHHFFAKQRRILIQSCLRDHPCCMWRRECEKQSSCCTSYTCVSKVWHVRATRPSHITECDMLKEHHVLVWLQTLTGSNRSRLGLFHCSKFPREH